MKQEIIRIDLNGVNCYLGKSGDNFILFDTGGHMTLDKKFTNRRELLEKELIKLGCKPGNLKLILLTHGDNDHVANAVYLRDKYQAPIAMHSKDLELVDNPQIDNLMESFNYSSYIYKLTFLVMKKTIRKLCIKSLEDFESIKPDIFVDEGFDLTKYGFKAKVLYTPGHTKGSISILTEEGELIAGDTFANMKKPSQAPNAWDFKVLRQSIKSLKGKNLYMIYPGHGTPFAAKELAKILQ